MLRLSERPLALGAFVVLFGAILAIVALAGPDGDTTVEPGIAGDDASRHSSGHGAAWRPGDGIIPWGLEPDAPPALSHEHTFPAGTGSVPTRSEALDFDKRFSSFRVKGSDGLARVADQGHLTGSGTVADPYVLARFYVDGDLVIENTERALIIREGYVTGQLRLNYVGGDFLMHHVYAKDLRVNENVQRGATETAGLFHDNEFGFIGQLRHFSGEFRDNEVGPRPNGVVTSYLGDAGITQLAEGVVFNFDGFHGGSVHGNKIHGSVDIKLHGHHHGDCLTCGPHDHVDKAHFPAAQAENETSAHHDAHDAHRAHDAHGAGVSHHDQASAEKTTWLLEKGLRSHHSIRYHSLHFFANEIHVEDGYALRYYDRAHRGDDETAASEANPYLEDPHVHYQYIWLQDNRLTGGHLLVDVFNAEDKRHALPNEGVLRIEGNDIRVSFMRETHPVPMVLGMDLTKADGITLLVKDNSVRFVEQEDDSILGLLPTGLKRAPELIGMRLNHLDRGNVTLTGNSVEKADVAVVAAQLGPRLWWDLEGNRFDASEEVRTHNVENEPGARPDDDVGQAQGAHAHEGGH